jgi:hypothetical protein
MTIFLGIVGVVLLIAMFRCGLPDRDNPYRAESER